MVSFPPIYFQQLNHACRHDPATIAPSSVLERVFFVKRSEKHDAANKPEDQTNTTRPGSQGSDSAQHAEKDL